MIELPNNKYKQIFLYIFIIFILSSCTKNSQKVLVVDSHNLDSENSIIKLYNNSEKIQLETASSKLFLTGFERKLLLKNNTDEINYEYSLIKKIDHKNLHILLIGERWFMNDNSNNNSAYYIILRTTNYKGLISSYTIAQRENPLFSNQQAENISCKIHSDFRKIDMLNMENTILDQISITDHGQMKNSKNQIINQMR